MTLKTADHYDLMKMFERDFKGAGRFDKEDKTMWPKGYIYQHGEINRLFLAYRLGAAYGRAIA